MNDWNVPAEYGEDEWMIAPAQYFSLLNNKMSKAKYFIHNPTSRVIGLHKARSRRDYHVTPRINRRTKVGFDWGGGRVCSDCPTQSLFCNHLCMVAKGSSGWPNTCTYQYHSLCTHTAMPWCKPWSAVRFPVMQCSNLSFIGRFWLSWIIHVYTVIASCPIFHRMWATFEICSNSLRVQIIYEQFYFQ